MAGRPFEVCTGSSMLVAFFFPLTFVSGFVAGTSQAATDTPGAQVQQFLDSEVLARTENPVAANFFLQQGRGVLPAGDEERAIEQLRLALRRQTSFMARTMESAIGAMSGNTLQQVMEQASKQSGARAMLGSMLGATPQPGVTTRQQQQIRAEIQEGMAGPWIRGVEAARALEQLGEAQAAGRFYVNCLQMDPAEWFAEVCLDSIVQMGPARSYALLNWIVDNAENASLGAQMAAMPDAKKGTAMPGAVPLRSAGLRGLGVIVGAGKLSASDRESAFAKLLAYSDGKDNAPYFAGAAAGLGLTKDPRAVEALRRLMKLKKDPRVTDAAQRALATGFGDKEARERLNRQLADDDIEQRLNALRALLEAGHEQAHQWAVDQVTSRRSADSDEMDSRPQIVRELAERRDPRARQTLQQILAKGAGNDWLQAWVAVALLELGDESQLPAVRQAVSRSNWTLDRGGIGSMWRRIRPLLDLAVQASFSQINVLQAVQTVSHMIAQERARAQRKATDQALVSQQIRWQAADALAASRDPGAVEVLSAMLDDPEPSVRLNAARAIAVSASQTAGPVIAKAFAADYGVEGAESRTPQVRAALLRAAIARDPAGARKLCEKAATDADPGVRFIALVALRRLS